MAKDNKVNPEVQEQLELLIQTMIDNGVVARVAPEPIYEQYGFQGRAAVGQTAEELHYDPSSVGEFITKTFRESHLDYLKDQVASFPSNPSLESLSEIVNLLSLGEGVVTALTNLSDTPQRKFVAYNSKIAQWPNVLSREYVSLRDNLSLQLSEAIKAGLEGVAEDLPEQRQERLSKLVPLSKLARESNVYLLSEVRNNLNFWDGVKILSNTKQATPDERWDLPREPHYLSDAGRAYVQSLKEDWGLPILFSILRGCDLVTTRGPDGGIVLGSLSSEKLPTLYGLTENTGLYWLDVLTVAVVSKVVGDLYSVGKSIHDGRKNAKTRKAQFQEYGLQMGREIISRTDLSSLAYERANVVLREHSNEFIPLDNLARAIFPVIYPGDQEISTNHQKIAFEVAKEVSHAEGGIIEYVQDKGTKLRYRPS
ncbi:MAG: hypothetical protein WCV90_01835 [Candidatus Woesearchaeota archaeon]